MIAILSVVPLQCRRNGSRDCMTLLLFGLFAVAPRMQIVQRIWSRVTSHVFQNPMRQSESSTFRERLSCHLTNDCLMSFLELVRTYYRSNREIPSREGVKPSSAWTVYNFGGIQNESKKYNERCCIDSSDSLYCNLNNEQSFQIHNASAFAADWGWLRCLSGRAHSQTNGFASNRANYYWHGIVVFPEPFVYQFLHTSGKGYHLTGCRQGNGCPAPGTLGRIP